MKATFLSPIGLLFLTVAVGIDLLAQAPSASDAGTNLTVVLTTEGKVEALRLGAPAWVPAVTNQTLRPRDRLRTAFKSRATLRLTDLSVLRVNQLTSLEIQPPDDPKKKAVLDLQSGAAYFFHRDEPADLEFRTPQASGAIRGTEFNLEVDDQGRTIVTMIDGEVLLANEAGQVSLTSGEQGTAQKGTPPTKTAVIEAINIIQWALYYPGILDLSELRLSAAEQQTLSESLEAYRAGDLLKAVEAYPDNRTPASDAERIYQAAVLLGAGQVAQTENLLKNLSAPSPLADALRQLIAAVKNQTWQRSSPPTLATEWLAESYYRQSRFELEPALQAARQATEKSPQFGYAWARLAEMEFSFGRTAGAMAALNRALQLSPRNAQAIALKGFLLSAQNKLDQALAYFNRAIALDGALGNAWLGRGLARIRRDALLFHESLIEAAVGYEASPLRKGEAEEGRQDLTVAATLEPNRAILRSYLGKAYSNENDLRRARKEIDLAKRLDPNDPTSWLYSALLAQQENRINRGVDDLRQSQNLNDNRSLFRSRLLLDQDQAVRGANLASIYRDAGMIDFSVREASRAVNYDLANSSAHLFLANSYDALRDPKQINLRYDAPWLSELFLANLLAPIGAGSLSQNVSQQEYSKLLERDRLGISSVTEYFSSGDWQQLASQFGAFGNSSYSLDADYRTEHGQRPNNDLDRFTFWGKFKQQVTPQDALFFQALYYDFESGDVAQYYNQHGDLPGVPAPSRTLRVTDRQEPTLFLGYHREWNPENHTLFLAGRLDSTLTLNDPRANFLFLTRNGAGQVTRVDSAIRPLDYRRELEGYSAELQHVWQQQNHAAIFGARYQTGELDARSTTGIPGFTQDISADLERISLYGYYYWQILPALQLTAGLSYDRLEFPRNLDVPPLSSGEDDKNKISPKVGLVWTPLKDTTLRAIYTRSLGGVSFDSTIRLEPTQIAGFNQAFRSLIPESVVGSIPGSEFETYGVGLEQIFKTKTYLTIQGELLKSEVEPIVGVVDRLGPFLSRTSGTRQELEFSERSLSVTINQLYREEWAFGASYRLTEADLDERFREFPANHPAADRDLEATLHQLTLFALFNHRSGLFAQVNSVWSAQSNHGYSPDIPGDDFWQFNAFVGYRFFQRRAEARIGLLNITDQDYQLNPLTLHAELPRERTLVVALKFKF